MGSAHNNHFFEIGMVQYFYHSPSSRLPVRDVKNECNMGFKTEPHIEVGAENLLKECYQRNIKKFIEEKRKYLFLLTTCRNPQMTENGSQFIVGYIDVAAHSRIPGENRQFVIGETKLFSFTDSLPVSNFFPWKSFSRIHFMHQNQVDEARTKSILGCLSGKPNILEDCIAEIERLDSENITCMPRNCVFKEECSRYLRNK